MANKKKRTKGGAKRPSEGISGIQRTVLSALLILVGLSLLCALTIYVERQTTTCRLREPAGEIIVACFVVNSAAGAQGFLVDEFLFHSRRFVGPLTVFLALLFFYPQVPKIIDILRQKWRDVYTPIALAATCGGLAAFILHFGNRQFGAFDFSIILEHGYRLVQGQVPYRDFVCTMPPGFFLGVKWAFLIFGLRWTGMLWGTAVFTAVTFLWTYALLRELLESRLAAFLTALSAQTASNLILCFWWYNNTASMTATVFFLSCLLYLKKEDSLWAQVSYGFSLALLGLMKPNIAGPTGLAGVGALWIGVSHRARLALLTTGAVGANLSFLFANHVSIPGLLSSYIEVAKARGQVPTLGLEVLPMEEKLRAGFFLAFLVLPYFSWWTRFRAAARTSNRRMAAICLLLLAAPLISIFGMLTNGEFKDVEWPIFICAGVTLLFSSLAGVPPQLRPAWRSRFYVCALMALSVCDIYMAVARYRVATIGLRTFFEWEGLVSPGMPFLADMQAGERFHRVLQQIQQVRRQYPGTVYFGPRLEFAYSVFGVPSPLHLAAWWDPGTAFAKSQEPAMQAAWRANRFQTIIFIKHEAVYHSRSFVAEMLTRYRLDERWSELTIMHSDVPGGAPLPGMP